VRDTQAEGTGMATSTAPFTGFQPAAIEFLIELAMNNERAWFQPRKAEYERLLREPMESLVSALLDRFRARDIPLEADPRRAVFRVYRDTRFSKDKSPYKTNVGASIPWVAAGGDGPHGLGVYLHFQPGDSFAGGGMYMMERPRLDAFRRLVVEQPDRVLAAVEEPAFTRTFGGVHGHESLKRVPPGYPADHPQAELLKMKDVTFGRALDDDEFLSPDLADTLADDFATAIPVFRLLASLPG
jgi:uncharacterized protein (TIGR02453 family)